MPSSVGNLLDVARREIGTSEQPRFSNRQKYGAWGGFNGVPWCSWYVCWVAHHAGAPEFVALRGRPKGSAYSGDILDKYRTAGRLSMNPQVGDFVVWDWPNAGTANDHIGIVESVFPNGVIETIEGNSPGSGFGYDVVGRHMRNARKSVRGYCHPVYTNAPQPSKPQPQPVKRSDPMYVIQGDRENAVFSTNHVTKQWLETPALLAVALVCSENKKIDVISQDYVDNIPLVGLAPPRYPNGQFNDVH